MKSLFMITLVLAAATTAHAQTKRTTHEKQNIHTVQAAKKHLHATAAHATATAATAPEDILASYIGTNDFYLALVREGVKRT